MTEEALAAKAEYIGKVAAEAAEESDAIQRNPEIIDVLGEIAAFDGLNDRFGGNGHDPNAYVAALANGLAPYRVQTLEERPELVQSLGFLSWVLEAQRSPDEIGHMQLLA
ncbi:MAG TPA: hypothetical protein VLL27_10075 [Solirubrobacterales bacterium]|nr:hypothetical protein [Solirubrobacterales bacterium]